MEYFAWAFMLYSYYMILNTRALMKRLYFKLRDIKAHVTTDFNKYTDCDIGEVIGLHVMFKRSARNVKLATGLHLVATYITYTSYSEVPYLGFGLGIALLYWGFAFLDRFFSLNGYLKDIECQFVLLEDK